MEKKPSTSSVNIPLVTLSSEETPLSAEQDDVVQALVSESEDKDPEGPHPRALGTRSKKLLLAAGDISLVFLPLLFIVLSVSALRLDSKPASDYGRAMTKLSNFGPTIFPIIFTTIVGRLMNSIAYYQAERGTSLRMIEQLVQSQSFASSIEAAASLRKLTTGGFFIVSVWLLSPLGGQSSLRALGLRTDVRERSRLIHHLYINTCLFWGRSTQHFVRNQLASAIFMTSVIASNSTNDSPVDPWNNVKVPIQKSTQADEQGSYPWVPVVANNSMDYLSLIGLRFWNIPRIGRTEFVMESSYLVPNCTKQPRLTKEEWLKAQLPNSTFDSLISRGQYDDTGQWYNNKSYINIQFAIHTNQEFINGYLYNCTLRSTSLDVYLICHGANCKVNQTRAISPKTRPHWEVPWNAGDCRFVPSECLSTTLDLMRQTFSRGDIRYNTPIEAFLRGNSPFDQWFNISFEDVSDLDFSVRFGQLLNAIHVSTQLYGANAGSIHEREPEDLEGREYKYVNRTARVFHERTVYEAGYIWIVFLTVASFFLLICCCITFYIHQWVSVPDIFGFVATSVSDSPSVAQYPVGSYVDGWERARALGDPNVRFEDIALHEAHGKLALVASESVAELTSLQARKQVFSKRLFS